MPIGTWSYVMLNVDSQDGPFLTVNQSMFAEVEIANQWHCRTHNNNILLYTKEHVLFVCDQTCEQLTQE